MDRVLIDHRNEEKSFNSKYETLTPNVVPRSAQKIAQDDEFSLYGVTLFSRDVTEFNHRCRELKYHLSISSSLTIDGSRATSSTQILSSVAKPKNSIKPPKPKKSYGYLNETRTNMRMSYCEWPSPLLATLFKHGSILKRWEYTWKVFSATVFLLNSSVLSYRYVISDGG